MGKFFEKVDKTIFFVSLIATIAFVAWYWAMPDAFTAATGAIFTGMNTWFGWIFNYGYTFFVVAMLFLAFSKYGKIRLGYKQNDKAEFPLFTWVAMMFAAGLGVGITYYGIYVTLDHLANPPMGYTAGSIEAGFLGINFATFYHALHPWAGYLIVGLIIAYFSYNLNAGGLFSTPLIYAFGKPNADGTPRREAGWGKIIDAYVIFMTLGGICASYSLATGMIASGVEYIFGIPSSPMMQLIILVICTVILIASTNSGVAKGMALMSDWNLRLCIIILVMFVILGPTQDILASLLQCMGDLIYNFIPMSFFMDSMHTTEQAMGLDYARDWIQMLWAFFMAWTPFVGIFVAKVSRGRSIRELVLGGMFMPTIFAWAWNSIVGSTAVFTNIELNGGLMEQINGAWSSCLFALYTHMPLTIVFGVLSFILIVTFILTSCDSADYTIAVLCCRGDLNPPAMVRVVWAIIMSAMATLFLFGGAGAIQNIQGISTLPMMFIIPVMFWGFMKMLTRDYKTKYVKQLRMEQIQEWRDIDATVTAEDEAEMGIKMNG